MMSNMVTVKCDVYNFGILLLELIRSLLPIIPKQCHVQKHVKLQGEDITSVIDRRLGGEYDDNSVRKVLELAKYNHTV